MKTFKTTALSVVTALICLANQVSALTISSSEYVGLINPGHPANEADQVNYVNALLDLAPGGTGSIAGQSLERSANVFASLPDAVLDGSSRVNYTPEPTVDVTVDVTGFTYLVGKYDGPNDGTHVWYVGDLTGNQTVPFRNRRGLSNVTLYKSAPPQQTPDGGATAALLGMGLLGMAAFRQKR